MTETNSPEQDRASGCKTNSELTGQSPKERGERVFSTAQCAVKPYGWHAAANGLFTVDERVAEVWRGHMGLNVTAVYAAQPPAAPVEMASGNINCSRCGGNDPGCYICRDYPHRCSAETSGQEG